LLSQGLCGIPQVVANWSHKNGVESDLTRLPKGELVPGLIRSDLILILCPIRLNEMPTKTHCSLKYTIAPLQTHLRQTHTNTHRRNTTTHTHSSHTTRTESRDGRHPSSKQSRVATWRERDGPVFLHAKGTSCGGDFPGSTGCLAEGCPLLDQDRPAYADFPCVHPSRKLHGRVRGR
jgi:hypothetical protein